MAGRTGEGAGRAPTSAVVSPLGTVEVAGGAGAGEGEGEEEAEAAAPVAAGADQLSEDSGESSVCFISEYFCSISRFASCWIMAR